MSLRKVEWTPKMAIRLFWLAAVTLVIAGCGEPAPKLVQVTGTVTMDGKGLTAGSIYFTPTASEYNKDNPSSLLQLDGSFTMKTYPFGDGVAPGKYKVSLAPELANRVKKPEYGKPSTSPWPEVEVTATGVQGLNLEVK